MPFCRAPGPPQAPPQGPPGEDRALRQAYLDLQHLHKLKLFLESEVGAPEADADEHSVRSLQLDLKNLQALRTVSPQRRRSLRRERRIRASTA